MKFIIYGAGLRGKMFSKSLMDNIVAFIDQDKEKIGKKIYGIPVISLDEYIKYYSDVMIIISPLYSVDIEQSLRKNGIYNYCFIDDLPTELQLYGKNKLFFYLFKHKFNENYIFLYGISAYSLVLCEKLKKIGKEVVIIRHDYCDNNRYQTIKKYYGDTLNFADIDEKIISKLYISVPENKKVITRIFGNIDIEDISNIYGELYPYQNDKISCFRNSCSHLNRCFIVATGPSLKGDDLQQLYTNNDFCFGVNGIIFDKSRWRPDVLVVGDFKFFTSYKQEIYNYKVKYKFLNNKFIEIDQNLKKDKSVIPLYSGRINSRGVSFSDDITKIIYDGKTIVYICLQIAVYLGFKEIYLLGVDCDYDMPGNDHFYGNEGGGNIKHCVEERFEAFKIAKYYAEKNNINIYNATRGGKLEIFPRVDFDTLF